MENESKVDSSLANETLYQLSYDPIQFIDNGLQPFSPLATLCFYTALLCCKVQGMKSAHTSSGEFCGAGENLCRYSSNGVYYARFRIHGKLIHRSPDTRDRNEKVQFVGSATGPSEPLELWCRRPAGQWVEALFGPGSKVARGVTEGASHFLASP